MHPAPGNASGTLVNGILHHCSLPFAAFSNEEILSDAEDISEDDLSIDKSPNELNFSISGASIRPGIVHRLDKGTSGLLVVAKVIPQPPLPPPPLLENCSTEPDTLAYSVYNS